MDAQTSGGARLQDHHGGTEGDTSRRVLYGDGDLRRWVRRSPEPRRTTWVRLLAIAATVVAALALSGPADATGDLQTFLQFNLCGNACNRGGLQVVTRLEDAIDARRPFAVTLNEVCENQFARLRTDLVLYHGRFDPTGPTCHNGSRYGNAILVRAANATLVGGWNLPNPAGDETRRLVCLRTQQPRLIICVTHISNYVGNIAAQVAAVAGILRRLTVGDAVLLAGDFNTDPADPRLNPMYSGCYRPDTGIFREAAGCPGRPAVNEATYGVHKYDYIFLSDVGWSSTVAHAEGIADGLSDHKALWATATVRR